MRYVQRNFLLMQKTLHEINFSDPIPRPKARERQTLINYLLYFTDMQTKNIIFLIIGVLILFSIVFLWKSNIHFTELNGTVIDQDSNPVPNAKIEYLWQARGYWYQGEWGYFPKGFVKFQDTITNEQGQFFIPSYNAGIHPFVNTWKEIRVTKENYCGAEKIALASYQTEATFSCVQALENREPPSITTFQIWTAGIVNLPKDAKEVTIKMVKLNETLSQTYQDFKQK